MNKVFLSPMCLKIFLLLLKVIISLVIENFIYIQEKKCSANSILLRRSRYHISYHIFPLVYEFEKCFSPNNIWNTFKDHIFNSKNTFCYPAEESGSSPYSLCEDLGYQSIVSVPYISCGKKLFKSFYLKLNSNSTWQKLTV